MEKERTQVLQREAERVVTRLTPGQRALVQIIEEAAADQLQVVANFLKAKGFAGIAILFGKSGGTDPSLGDGGFFPDSSIPGWKNCSGTHRSSGWQRGRPPGDGPWCRPGPGEIASREKRALELVAGI